MFEDATFESRGMRRNDTPKWMLVALAFNAAVVTTMIVVPLVYPEGLPTTLLRRALYVPSPQVQARVQPQTSQSASTQTTVQLNPYLAPTSLPIQISHEPVGPAPVSEPLDLPSGPMTGGDNVAGGTGVFHTGQAPVVVKPAPVGRQVVSQGVIEGLLIQRTMPVYPVIARTAGISGTVVLAAVISKGGAIEDLRVVSGNPMLQQAALHAVREWRYRPYLLNGQPVEVETTVNVVFSMGNR
jgi:protein TonB